MNTTDVNYETENRMTEETETVAEENTAAKTVENPTEDVTTEETPVQQEKPRSRKKIMITSICGGIAAVLLVVGIILLSTVVKNNARAAALADQLKGMRFSETNEWESIDTWSVTTFEFDSEGEMTYNYWHYSGSLEEDRLMHNTYTSTPEVKVSFFGDATVGLYDIVTDGDEITALRSSTTETIYEVDTNAIRPIEYKAVGVFGKTEPWKGYNFNKVIPIVFKDGYTVYCEPVDDSDTKFEVTVSGTYYPNKADIPSYTQKGEMVSTIDLETGECKIIDGTEVYRAMEVYVILGTNYWSPF